jgi:galactose mutarotase-like enzyme
MLYEIKDGKSKASVNTMGGEMVSFIHGGLEYVWTGDPEYWSGHAPVLFPTVGSLKNRETEINGVTYPMKKHGFARKTEFRLLDLKANHAVFSLTSNPEIKNSYPFDFELQTVQSVYEGGFKTEYRVINTDARDILFGIGGHAGFNCPLFEGTQFSDYTIRFEKTENGPFYYTRTEDCDGVIHKEDRVTALEGKNELPLDYSLFDRDVLVLGRLESRSLKLVCNKNGRGIEFIMNGFTSMGIWSTPIKKAPFVCLEPWTVNPDFSDASGKFSEKPGITTLKPGGVFTVSYETKII